MVIREVSAVEVLTTSRTALGLSQGSVEAIDAPMLAASLRRAAGFLCPCSPSTLVNAVWESLKYLSPDDGNIEESIKAAINGLVIGGDLLELNQVTTDDPDVKGTWIFLAPPGFVARPDGSFFLIGIARDEVTPLPTSLASRICYTNFARVLAPQPSEDLRSIFRGLGLGELSRSSWLKSPKVESLSEFYDRMTRRLEEQPPSGKVADVSVLDSAKPPNYYAGRWHDPADESGYYLARRPQAYGAPLWGFAKLEKGAVVKFLDFPLPETRWRGCDIAWHLQMAIDQRRGAPQLYRLRPDSTGAYLDFFSPLPLWAERSNWRSLGILSPKKSASFPTGFPSANLRPNRNFFRSASG